MKNSLTKRIGNQNITFDEIKFFAKGIIEIHDDLGLKELIPFGMLNAKTMEDVEKLSLEKINGYFSDIEQLIYKRDIVELIVKTVTIEIYNQTKMIV